MDLDVREGTNCENLSWNEKKFPNYIITGERENLPACLGQWIHQEHRSDPAGTCPLRAKSSLQLLRVFFQRKLSQELGFYPELSYFEDAQYGQP